MGFRMPLGASEVASPPRGSGSQQLLMLKSMIVELVDIKGLLFFFKKSTSVQENNNITGSNSKS